MRPTLEQIDYEIRKLHSRCDNLFNVADETYEEIEKLRKQQMELRDEFQSYKKKTGKQNQDWKESYSRLFNEVERQGR